MEKPFLFLLRMSHRVLPQHNKKINHFLFFSKKYHFLVLFRKEDWGRTHRTVIWGYFVSFFPEQMYQATKILPRHNSICNNVPTEVLCESPSSRSVSLLQMSPPLHPYACPSFFRRSTHTVICQADLLVAAGIRFAEGSAIATVSLKRVPLQTHPTAGQR